MPLVSPIDIAVLSSPIPMPGETGTIAPSSFGTDTQQNIQAMTSGSGVTSPIGTGNIMTPVAGQLESGSTITGAALESGGANVGGVVQQAPKEDLETKLEFASLEDQKIAAQEKAQEEQADEFMKAYEEGVSTKREELLDEGVDKAEKIYDSLSDKNKERLSKLGLDSEKIGVGLERVGDILGGEKTGMRAARTVKRKDRRADRKARKEAGLKGSEKRAMRKAQRKSRRSAFKDFKSERDYQASLDAAQL